MSVFVYLSKLIKKKNVFINTTPGKSEVILYYIKK